MKIRDSKSDDLQILAEMNHQLIQDEGHRNQMTVSELSARMSDWLSKEYRAAMIETADTTIGYSLWREESDHIYIRQFFVEPAARRKGAGSKAIDLLKEHYWHGSRLRLEVLTGNEIAASFWRSVGFSDYCLTMESANA